jgi:hypothetical protein
MFKKDIRMTEVSKKQLERQAEHEIELRGIMLNVAIKFEVALMNIIYFSNAQQYINPKESKSLKIKYLTFGKKLERAKDLLAEFHQDLFQLNENLFFELGQFLLLRNKLAHCTVYWVNEGIDTLEIWDVVEKDNFEFFAPTPYSNFGIREE